MKKGTIDGAGALVAWAGAGARDGTARIIVAALRTAEEREPLADERGQILRLTRRHEVAVDDDLLIDDVRADELEVALDRPPGGQPVILVRAGGQEELRPVADREDRLLPLEERLDERDRRVVRAKAIRREAARDEQGVELVGPHVRERAAHVR